MNVEVEVVSDDSIRVSWDSIDLPEIPGYVVHYSLARGDNTTIEHSVKLSNNSVLICCLMTEIEYLFRVAALAEMQETIESSANFSYLLVYPAEGKMLNMSLLSDRVLSFFFVVKIFFVYMSGNEN